MKPALYALAGAFFFSGAIGAFVKHSPAIGIPLGIACTIGSIFCVTMAFRSHGSNREGEKGE